MLHVKYSNAGRLSYLHATYNDMYIVIVICFIIQFGSLLQINLHNSKYLFTFMIIIKI